MGNIWNVFAAFAAEILAIVGIYSFWSPVTDLIATFETELRVLCYAGWFFVCVMALIVIPALLAIGTKEG